MGVVTLEFAAYAIVCWPAAIHGVMGMIVIGVAGLRRGEARRPTQGWTFAPNAIKPCAVMTAMWQWSISASRRDCTHWGYSRPQTREAIPGIVLIFMGIPEDAVAAPN